jgi:hypothetical protein
MIALFVRLAVALIRGWTAVYTRGLPPHVRAARRAEIDSDLWEARHAEPADVWLPLHMMWRLALGVADDLGWRGEQQRSPRAAARVAWAVAAAVVSAVFFTVFWMGRTQRLPVPAPLVRAGYWDTRPPPPPPPPPPCPPPGGDRPAVSPCTQD